MTSKDNPDSLSIVVPAFNEADGILQFYKQLRKVVKDVAIADTEIIFVDDGSTDKTLRILQDIEAKDPRVQVMALTRNFGKEACLSAGIHHASKDIIATLDADGQHPPQLIAQFISELHNGFDMVIGLRTDNADEKSVKKFGNMLYYRLLKSIGISHLQPKVTDFRVFTKDVAIAFNNFAERRRITRGLLDWMGFRTSYIEFEAPERIAGTATYDFKKLTYLAADSVLSNSRKPLALSLLLGGFITAISLFGVLFFLIQDFLLGDPLNLNITGSAFLILLALFMIGLIFISQGIVSVYLARIYEEVQDRPLYIVDSSKSATIQRRRKSEKDSH